jgi:branched-chain amino acid transport system substrate-binding protein
MAESQGETKMGNLAKWRIAAALLGFAIVGIPAAQAADTVEIDVILALTGPGAFLGTSEQQSMQLIEKSVNANGGIHGRPLHFNFYDDQTTPQVSVQLANEVIAKHPAVLIGSSLVATCSAMAPLMQNGPVMYCLSPGIYPAAGSYVFTNNVSTHGMTTALIRFFRSKGWTRLAVTTSTDATGQEAETGIDGFLTQPENRDIKLVEKNKFNTTDISVAAQLERIKDAGAQAYIPWTTGASVATILRGMVQVGLDIPTGVSNGNMTYAQMNQYADFLPKQLYIPSSLWPAGREGRIPVPAAVAAKQKEFYADFAAAGISPDGASVLGWDPVVLVIDALQKLGPDISATQLRDYLIHLKGAAGVNGIYDFEKMPQRGLGLDDTVVTRWSPGKKIWEVVSTPGGAPLN